MAKRKLTLNELRKILRSFGVQEDRSGGKGSHTKFYRIFADGRFTYPVPTHSKDVKDCYVKGCRRKFHLTEEDGTSDDEFFGRA